MPKNATMPQWRTRREAISKKFDIDGELHLENETIIIGKKQPEEIQQPVSSPTSIFQLPDLIPEMQPIVLPGSWLVVGKGGKPILPTKMYEEPIVAKKKKKKKSRTRKAEATQESIWALEESPSSSKCLQSLHTATAHHEKLAMRGQTVKYWKRYRDQRRMKIHARDVLLASALFREPTDDTEPDTELPIKTRDNKKDGTRDKARRRARDAKASHHFWLDDQPIAMEFVASLDDEKTIPPSAKSSSPISSYEAVTPPTGADAEVAVPQAAEEGKRQKKKQKTQKVTCIIA